jgi:hypothetical protein
VMGEGQEMFVERLRSYGTWRAHRGTRPSACPPALAAVGRYGMRWNVILDLVWLRS